MTVLEEFAERAKSFEWRAVVAATTPPTRRVWETSNDPALRDALMKCAQVATMVPVVPKRFRLLFLEDAMAAAWEGYWMGRWIFGSYGQRSGQ